MTLVYFGTGRNVIDVLDVKGKTLMEIRKNSESIIKCAKFKWYYFNFKNVTYSYKDFDGKFYSVKKVEEGY